MATSSLNSIRVRLYFDYPPPSTPECRMCWLLVDLNKCRVVADLSSIIKEKFGYSRRTLLDLFIEDCYLPTTESIYIVRDNDSVRVKVSSSVVVNGAEAYQNCEVHNSKGKKRGREDETQITQASSKKTKQEDAQVNGSAPTDNGKKKKKRKKQKKEQKQSANNPETSQKTVSLKEQAAHSSNKADRKSTSSDKTTTAKNQESTSSSSDSSEDESKSKPSPPKPKPKQTDSTKKPTAAARKETSSSDSDSSDDAPKPSACKSNIPVTPKSSLLPATPKLSTSINSKIPLQTPKQRRSSTDSSSSSSSSPSQLKPTSKKSQIASQPSSSTQSCLDQSVSASGSKKPQNVAQSSDSDASEIELVIKKPNLYGMGLNIAGLRSGTSESAGRTRGQERGRGRGANRGSGRGGFGRAKGTPWKQDFRYNYENGERQKQRDSLTNESFIIQNAPEPEPAPKRDYTTLPLLAAPPVVGQKIAFKLLELTENYTPEVSEYKEGKIIAFNPQTKMIELELLSKFQAPVEPGKFDLVYENPDGSERVEYAVTHGSQLTECWDSLLEPRLILENAG